MVKTSCFCRFNESIIKWHKLRRQLDDNCWLEEVLRRYEKQNIQLKKCKWRQFWCILIFRLYLELHTSDRCDLYTILKLRDRSTFGMKTMKFNSAFFLAKKSKHRNWFVWLRAETGDWPVDSISIISWSTELQIGWFLSIGKLTQRTTTVMFFPRS